MVFVYVPPPRRQAAEVTPEELAKIRELRARGLEGETLERALVANGVHPERARLLAAAAGPPTAAALARAVGVALGVMALGIFLALAKGPLREWLHENWPGSEWLVGLIIPFVVLLVVLWQLRERLRSASDAPEGTTRADQIDNRPIG